MWDAGKSRSQCLTLAKLISQNFKTSRATVEPKGMVPLSRSNEPAWENMGQSVAELDEIEKGRQVPKGHSWGIGL